MVELIVAITVVVIFSLIIYGIRKKASKKAASETNLKAAGTARQSQTLKPGLQADAPVLIPEPQSVHSEEIQHVEPVFDPDPSIKPTSNTAILETESRKYGHLPEDSMLRRHYLTHLFGMIESTRSSLPTDSALSHHYNAMIIAEMEECLSSNVKMDQLVRDYEKYKKSLAMETQKPEAMVQPSEDPIATTVKHENPKLPEDSMLRRHHLTHLRALVESKAPQCPTDSTLRRHYEAMIENEVNKLL
ncbi:MAG: hypothetical protein PHG00_15575 [Methylococcales bacterium]|nr:hypothetical protein [Methylococcales bacterium]